MCVDFCKENGAFIPENRGCCPDVDSLAQKALRTRVLALHTILPCCEMREVTSVEEGHDVEHVTEMRQCDMTSATLKLAREIDETTSDVVSTVEVPQTQYIDRVMGDP